MKILVLETHPGTADVAAESLRAAGHSVVRCHRTGHGPFPCTGLLPGGRCPVEEGVDVALTMRAARTPYPAPLEQGVSCALRAGVPLVVGGSPFVDPYVEYVSAVAHGNDVVGACEWAAMVGKTDQHAEIVRNELASICADNELDASGLDVTVNRRGTTIDVVVHVPASLEHALHRAISVRVVGRLRGFDPTLRPQVRLIQAVAP